MKDSENVIILGKSIRFNGISRKAGVKGVEANPTLLPAVTHPWIHVHAHIYIPHPCEKFNNVHCYNFLVKNTLRALKS